MSAHKTTSYTPEGYKNLDHYIKQFFALFTALNISHLFDRIFLAVYSYHIEDQIVSPATRIIFTHSMCTNQPICLKMWRLCNNEVYNMKDEVMCLESLLEGLEFNQRFARKAYLGIAPVEEGVENTIHRGRLLKLPVRAKLKPGRQYALIMRRLDENWHLDHLLCEGKLNTKSDIEFLAKEVARMHKLLTISPKGEGKPESVSLKLALNRRLFDEALNQLAHDGENIDKYRLISGLMDQVCRNYSERFDQRYRGGYIKRCHGDLKVTNLWIRPERILFCGLKRYQPQLLALDCVDFRPEFYYIDTLSDVALLAIDIEARLTDWSDKSVNKLSGHSIATYFLCTYLREVQEDDETAWPLLEYYMTEKAMVCAYMIILYGGLPCLSKRYLDVALVHAERLKKLLPCSKNPLAA